MNRRNFLTTAAALPLAGFTLPAFAQAGTIVDIAAATPDLSTLVTAVQAAGLVDALSAPGRITVFAPTNRAFDHLPPGALDGLLADTAALTDVLTYHVSPDYYPASALVGNYGRIPTLQGDFLLMDARNDGVVLNRNVRVTTADVMASNGVVHIIDAVLLPH